MKEGLDISANRRAAKYGAGELLRRGAWQAVGPAFRYSLRPLFGWRARLLRLFGARIGVGVHIYGSARILMPWQLTVGDWSAIGEDVRVYNVGMITLGQRVTVSHGAHLCAGTHDHARRDFPLVRAPIQIGDDAWICADAFVGPGVTVGEGAVVGARAVVVRDVAPWTIVAGNPARHLGERRLEPE